MQNQPINQTCAAVQQIAGKTPPTGHAAADQERFIPPTNKKYFSEGVAMRQPTVAAALKQTRKRAGCKKEKIVTRINLPEAVVQWVSNTFQGKERNTAYQFAFAAHLQVSKIVQRKNYSYICLPKSTLAKYITDKNLCSIKQRFAEGQVIYQKGWKKTTNGNYMHKYSFNEEMFLSRLVKVDIHSFKSLSSQTQHNQFLPLSCGEGGGLDMKGVYMGRNLLSTTNTLNKLTIKNHKTMKKEISYNEVLTLKNEGFTHEQIGGTLGCSTKKIQRVLKEHEVDKLDSGQCKPANHSAQTKQVDSEVVGNAPAINLVDSGRAGKAAPSNEVDNKFESDKPKTSLVDSKISDHVEVDNEPKVNAPSEVQENPVPHQPNAAENLAFTKQQVEAHTLQNLKLLSIDIEKLNALTPERIQSAIGSIKVISRDVEPFHIAYRFMGNETVYHGNTFNIFHDKIKGNDALIRYNDKYYIGDLNLFKEQKRHDVEFCLKQNLQFLSNPDCYRAHINDTNGRLDSTLTNLWGGFKGQILHDNDCCEIDIVNSQMAFFASHLKTLTNANSIVDVINFIYFSENGSIYEHTAKLLKIDRNAAKKILFHVLLSNYKTNDQSIEHFKLLFPSVYKYIRDWKKTNGSKYFSIMLQKMESEMMINCVLKELTDRKIFCFSVHDSVICRKGQVKEVMSIMQGIFKEQNFKCELFSKYADMERGKERPKRTYYPAAPNQAERILTEEDLKLSWTEEEIQELNELAEKIVEEFKQKESGSEKPKAEANPKEEIPTPRSDEEFEEMDERVDTEDEDDFDELMRGSEEWGS